MHLLVTGAAASSAPISSSTCPPPRDDLTIVNPRQLTNAGNRRNLAEV
jgi:hypothetical protein